jgi:two-component system, OmpR family, alkaline phosphatase synthesis response regulator PhoP
MAIETKVLVLDDEKDLCEGIVQYLNEKGFKANYSTTIDDFHEKLRTFAPHFLLIDKFINRQDSFSLITQIRGLESSKAIPIIVITGCEDFEEKIKALKMGADDVLIKPIKLEELHTKIQAILRRSFSYQPANQDVLYKNLTLSPGSGEVFMGEAKLALTETEFKLLHELVVEKGRPVHREYLAYKGLTSRNNNFRTIDVHINSLRTKLDDMGNKIKTLRGRGYMLVD